MTVKLENERGFKIIFIRPKIFNQRK